MPPANFNDLRGVTVLFKQEDSCRMIEAADGDLEMGAITEMQCTVPDLPLLMFDTVMRYRPGYRRVSNVLNPRGKIRLIEGCLSRSRG